MSKEVRIYFELNESENAAYKNLWSQTAHTAQHLYTNNPVKKWAEHLKRHFSKEDIQMAHRYMKDDQHCS